MAYIDNNLLAGERILFRTKKHYILFFFPAIWTIFCIFAANYMYNNPLLIKLTWAPWLIAFIFWIYVWLEYVTSDFVVTDKRLMMREGFFTRHTTELRLSAIAQVNVDQSLLGQLLNYGSVSINAFGASDAFTLIAKPFIFQKTVNARLDQIVR